MKTEFTCYVIILGSLNIAEGHSAMHHFATQKCGRIGNDVQSFFSAQHQAFWEDEPCPCINGT